METDYISLDEAKGIVVTILDAFDAFCREHNLQYWISDGTLLGAVRHGGIIPWDDDVDVCMPTKDYMKFLELVGQGARVAEHMDVVAFELQDEYYRPWARVYDNRTELVDGQGQHLGQRCDMDLYPFIDVFPLMGFSDKSWKRTLQTKRLFIKMRMLSLVSGPKQIEGRALPRMLKSLMRPIACAFGQKRLMKSIQREYAHPNRETFSNPLLGEIYDSIGFFIPSELYTETTALEFEGRTYPAPARYKDVLSIEYGDFMQLPPEDKRHIEYETVARWKAGTK